MLSKLLNQAANAGEFAYHPQCQEVKCTYLSFEDEIFVITNGTTLPLLEIMKSTDPLFKYVLNAKDLTSHDYEPLMDKYGT
ncbi:hypothetical protein F2Q69_00019661 [Brassica cretica]|uniref:Uncharacterized protein n=1 Tax=Brassica cretica TaxID=69181 RepID=A0A8S9QCP0_BRACR|nr:hypothetical protein F2Q69_00019661 [Brassica cretica]